MTFLNMLNIQHIQLKNTRWLAHDEAQVNPLVGYAGNVSLGDCM